MPHCRHSQYSLPVSYNPGSFQRFATYWPFVSVLRVPICPYMHRRSSGLGEQDAMLEQLGLHHESVTAIFHLDGTWANTLQRSDLRQEAQLLSRALQHHQERIEDPAGRMRERFCMMLRIGAWCEEMNLSTVWMPYSAAVAMLPRLHSLGPNILTCILALRRVNAPVAAASLRPSADSSGVINTLPAQHTKDTSPETAVRTRTHLLNLHVELDWMQRRQEAQELEAIVQDTLKIHHGLEVLPAWLPPSLDEKLARLSAHNGHLIYLVCDLNSCNIVLFDGTTVNGGRTLRLPGLSITRLKQLATQLSVARAESRARTEMSSERKMMIVGPRRHVGTRAVLAELWKILVHPIIKAFGFQVPSDIVRTLLRADNYPSPPQLMLHADRAFGGVLQGFSRYYRFMRREYTAGRSKTTSGTTSSRHTPPHFPRSIASSKSSAPPLHASPGCYLWRIPLEANSRMHASRPRLSGPLCHLNICWARLRRSANPQ
jgi:hypothetical protein